MLALQREPGTISAFRSGAEGEALVAERLRRACGPDVQLLFNRSLGAGRRDGDIDVLAVTPTGVHVIDVKKYARATVRVRRTGGLISFVTEQLMVNGRDQTRLLASVKRQEDAVRDALSTLPWSDVVPLHLALCFVGSDLPLFAKQVQGVAVLGAKGLAKRLNSVGSLGPTLRASMTRHLAVQLPVA